MTLGLVAPGVTTSQFSAGFSYRVTRNSSIDLAGYYAPKGKVSGPEVTPFGPTPGSNITASLSEAQVTIGWTYHFELGSAAAGQGEVLRARFVRRAFGGGRSASPRERDRPPRSPAAPACDIWLH